MIIRRAGRAQRFTILDNDVIEDNELSFRALGLLTYLLSKPDDWAVDAESLAETHAEGRDAVRAALEHLELAGYAVRRRFRTGGRYATETVIYDRPHDRDLNGAISHRNGKPALVNRAGKSGPLTSTDTKDGNQRVPKGTASTGGRRAKRPFGQPLEEPESPSLGTSPTAAQEQPAPVRPPRNAGRTPAMPDRIDYTELTPAAEAADTPHRCALRFKQLSIKNRSIDPANLMEFTVTLKRWYADGLELDVLRTMVDIFAARPESYMTGRQDIPWRAFINAREKLQADATKVSEAKNPSSKFGSAYSRAAAR